MTCSVCVPRDDCVDCPDRPVPIRVRPPAPIPVQRALAPPVPELEAEVARLRRALASEQGQADGLARALDELVDQVEGEAAPEAGASAHLALQAHGCLRRGGST